VPNDFHVARSINWLVSSPDALYGGALRASQAISSIGTKQTWRDVRVEAALRAKADINSTFREVERRLRPGFATRAIAYPVERSRSPIQGNVTVALSWRRGGWTCRDRSSARSIMAQSRCSSTSLPLDIAQTSPADPYGVTGPDWSGVTLLDAA